MREQDISPRKDFPAQPGPPSPLYWNPQLLHRGDLPPPASVPFFSTHFGACRDVRPARGPEAQWRRLCRGKGRDCLQRLACADVAAT